MGASLTRSGAFLSNLASRMTCGIEAALAICKAEDRAGEQDKNTNAHRGSGRDSRQAFGTSTEKGMTADHRTQADGDARPRFIPPNAKLIGYLVARPAPRGLPSLRNVERADCTFCDGRRVVERDPGVEVTCIECRGTGKELRREDHFALDDDDDFAETDIGREDAY